MSETGGAAGTATGIPGGVGIPTTVGRGLATDGLTTPVVTDELGDGLEGEGEAVAAAAEAVLEAGGELLGDDDDDDDEDAF